MPPAGRSQPLPTSASQLQSLLLLTLLLISFLPISFLVSFKTPPHFVRRMLSPLRCCHKEAALTCRILGQQYQSNRYFCTFLFNLPILLFLYSPILFVTCFSIVFIMLTNLTNFLSPLSTLLIFPLFCIDRLFVYLLKLF